jgi:hypothetical protein
VTGNDGKIYVFGGFDGATPKATVMVYDPVADSWVTTPNPMPTPRYELAAAVFPPTGKIYVFGGRNPELRNVEEYDPLTDTWTVMEEMPGFNSGFSAVYSRCLNKILVLGGSGNTNNENFVFDPTVGSGGAWENAPPIPFPPFRSGPASVESPDGTIFTVGGDTVPEPSGIVDRYFPLESSWQPADEMPTPRSWPAVAVLGDRIYVLGGEKGNSAGDVCQVVESYGALGDGSECCTHSGIGSASSSRGFDFWLVEPYGDAYYRFALDIANAVGCGTASVTISNVVGGTTSINILPGQVHTLTFPDRSADGGVSPNGVYHVTSNRPVSVHTRRAYYSTYNDDAGIVLPVPTLDTDYRVAGYYHPVGGGANSVQVVATEPGLTHVDLMDAEGTLKDGVDIPQGTCFHKVTGFPTPQAADDMTGWRVVADKRVAVFSGTSAGYVLGTCCADQIYEQLLPVSGAVRSYAVCPTRTRPLGCGTNCAVDVFRFIGLRNGTSITTSPAVGSGAIDAGDFLEIITDKPHILTASEPVVGYQYLTSSNSPYGTNPSPVTGDPALLDVVPVEQFQSSYFVSVPSLFWENHFLNVTAPVGTNLELDGTPVTLPCETAGIVNEVEYCCARVEVDAGAHRITADRSFGLNVSGFVYDGSYAYVAGLTLPATFCIEGTSTGQAYTWWIDLLDDDLGSTVEPFEDSPGVLPVGATADVLASSFANRINVHPLSISLGIKAVATGSCFQVLGADHFSLRVGHASVTTCRVTSQGCTYNPTIRLNRFLPDASPGGGGGIDLSGRNAKTLEISTEEPRLIGAAAAPSVVNVESPVRTVSRNPKGCVQGEPSARSAIS